MVITCGIDPGAKGAAAFIADGYLEAYPMPSSTRELRELLFEVKPGRVFIEKAQSFPGQGIASAFSYGMHYGALLEVISSLDLPCIEVRPGIWTKKVHLGCSGDDAKEKSLAAARKLFPEFDFVAKGCRKPHDGMIDAALIAYWGAVFYGD